MNLLTMIQLSLLADLRRKILKTSYFFFGKSISDPMSVNYLWVYKGLLWSFENAAVSLILVHIQRKMKDS